MAVYSLFLTFLKQFLLSKNGSYSLKKRELCCRPFLFLDYCTFYSVANIPYNPINQIQ